MCKLFIHHPTLGEYPHFKPTHIEEEVRIIFTINRHKAVLPLYCSNGAWEPVLNLPEYCTTTRRRRSRREREEGREREGGRKKKETINEILYQLTDN